MPCQYYESPEEIAAAKKAANKKLTQPYKKELDLVTHLLCEVMTVLEKNNVIVPLNIDQISGLQPWWKEHKERDERRKINERAELRTQALKKLTAEEKRALGLIK